jgi:hypothetical protein
MRIFNHYESANGEMHVINPDGRLHLRRIENSSISGDAEELNAGEHGPCTPLEVHGVGTRLDNHLIPGLSLRLDGQLIGHGPGGHEESGLFAEHLGSFFLEGIDRWVFSEDIVSHNGGKHGSTHFGGRLSYRITAQVDKTIHPHIFLWILYNIESQKRVAAVSTAERKRLTWYPFSAKIINKKGQGGMAQKVE